MRPDGRISPLRAKAFLLVFDGFADWEPALALCEINKSGKFEVVTTGFSDRRVTTMGGLKISPETTLDAVNLTETAILVLPGGEMWEQESHPRLIALLDWLEEGHVPIAAICGATLEVTRAGLTRGRRHTSNSKGYLKARVPGYRDEEFYVDELAVTDRDVITASGLGSVEFAREVILRLSIYGEAQTQEWYEMFKRGVIPARYAL